MRPRRLEIEGFTSFKERLALDLTGLDLFAITGATGAGKSSLIDALVFALYGQVPRVSKEYRQLISHGAERIAVHLEFEVAGRAYRVVRTARASGGNAQTRLEARNGKGWEPLADRAREVEEQVRGIVGLDYDAFTRSVVLPQGQFDLFLKGRPDERRKILVALLNLEVYEEMHRLANAKAGDARREVDFLTRQLADDFADATAESLTAKREELAAIEAERGALARKQDAVLQGLELAGRVRLARRDHAGRLDDHQAEEARTKAAEATLREAGAKRDRLEKDREDHARSVADLRYDADRHALLLEARPRAERLADLGPRAERIEKGCRETQAACEQKRRALQVGEEALPALETAVEAARLALESARAGREELQRRHAAHELRRDLKASEPCPVCEQPVRKVPRTSAGADLGTADASLRQADLAARASEERLRRAQVATERTRGELAGHERELVQIEEQRAESRADVASLVEALTASGFEVDPREASRLAGALSAELKTLQKAREQVERLAEQGERLEEARSALQAELVAARAQVEDGRTRLRDLRARQEQAESAFVAARRDLEALREREGWSLGAAGDADEADALEALRRSRDAEATQLAGRAARLEAEIEKVLGRIARAAELKERRKERESLGALYTTLAQHLRADQFLAYVQEEALRFLAEDGSRHLNRLSSGRYSLVCEDQEFEVVDHWNADARRSVKTLSGGETFLASLSLALALAESLARLSAEGRAGEALESLFLDEGFGTLDGETLDAVVDALEALQGGERMVGIVTHIPELAERLPARLEVKRRATTATAAVV
jgi:exonuclease SbcC